MMKYFAGLTLAQAKVIRQQNRLFLSRAAAGDRVGAARIAAGTLSTLGADALRVLAAQQAAGWHTPVLKALARMVGVAC